MDSYLVLKTASKYGAGLIKRLADAAIDASAEQRSRLLTAFPEIVDCYGPDTFLYRLTNRSTLPQSGRTTVQTTSTLQ
jgi:hypothetical protein